MPEDIDLGNGLMLRQLPEGSYTYPKAIPTEDTDTDPFAIAAARVRQGVKGRQQLPVDPETPYKAPNYLMAPDLLEAQQGSHLPTGIALNDAGIPFNKETGAEIPTAQRPNVLPIAMTPEGPRLAMPKILDLVGNVMGNVAAPAVATKAGEVVLGSGAVRTAQEATKVAEGPFYSALSQAVDNAKIGKASPEQWLGYLKNQPGVKAEEINTVLRDLPEGPLTKAEVQDIVKQNKVELKEVVKGDNLSEAFKKWNEVDLPEARLEKTRAFRDFERTIKEAGGDTNDVHVKEAATRLSKATERIAELERNKPETPASDTKYHGYQLPGSEPGSYKEMLLTLPENAKKYAYDAFNPRTQQSKQFASRKEAEEFANKDATGNTIVSQIETGKENFKSSHWDEPNVVAHIRHNDRNIPVDFTDAEKAALKAHEEAAPKLADIKNQQHQVSLSIRDESKHLERARRDRILADNKAGKLTNVEAMKQLENYEVPAQLKPLQDKLEALRKQEDDLRKSLPTKPEPKTSKTLHLEEWQSDLHQQGRDRGYVGEKEKLQPEFDKVEKKLMDTNDEKLLGQPTVKGVLKEAVDKKIITQEEANTYKRYTDIENQSPVPDLPFKKNWEELALKKALHKAASEGYEGLSWTPGEAQALRYQNDVRTKLSSVDWHNKNMGKVDPEGNKQILVTPSSGSEITLTVDKHGEIIKGHPELKGKMLDSVLGKDIAKQVLEKGEGGIDAKNYVMNSEGMKAAYDKRGVDIMNALGKKYGSKVEQRSIGKGWDAVDENGKSVAGWEAGTPKQAMFDWIKSMGGKYKLVEAKQPIHYMPITPELRQKAKQGFPLFSSVPVTVPVDFDPWKDDKSKRKYVITPVAHDPFK